MFASSQPTASLPALSHAKSIGTSNVLSVSSGLVGEVEFESPQEIHIDNLRELQEV